MSEAYDWLVEAHRQNPHVLKALLAGTLVSCVCGVIGCFIILRRTAFLADALAHSMLAGVVCGYLFMKLVFNVAASAPAMLIGSLLAGVVTVAMVGFVSRFSRIKEDTVIGIMYTAIFAFGGVLLSLASKHVHLDLVHFLTGQLLAVQTGDLWMMACVATVVLAVIVLFFRQLQLVSFDPVMAASIGMPVVALNYLLTTCTSLVVVSGVNVVGVILVVGLLIIPAGTAYLLCDRLNRMLMMSALFGFTSFLLGYIASEQANVAPGSAVVVASAAQFAVVLCVAPRYGMFADWLRRRRIVPQQLVEDVLGSVLRAPEDRVPLATVIGHVAGRTPEIQRAIRSLERSGLLMTDTGSVSLTDAGRHEAMRLLRAHRLWEAYLQHVGTPSEQLHDQAHLLEHVHDEAAVDYLDDKLGHPLRDPHGQEIPEDFVDVVPGAVVKASLLREGRSGTVVTIASALADLPLRVGMQVYVGPRSADEHEWTIVLPDGKRLRLDHQAMDAITVKLDENMVHGVPGR